MKSIFLVDVKRNDNGNEMVVYHVDLIDDKVKTYFKQNCIFSEMAAYLKELQIAKQPDKVIIDTLGIGYGLYEAYQRLLKPTIIVANDVVGTMMLDEIEKNLSDKAKKQRTRTELTVYAGNKVIDHYIVKTLNCTKGRRAKEVYVNRSNISAKEFDDLILPMVDGDESRVISLT